ncbi:MAG: ABC transporter ATP-binding protein [Burkholderiaceae bacterium]|nr:ABC transporter ATP-binding protein [Burkholderiaceae bacterium]
MPERIPPREPASVLRLTGISKRFGALVANDTISLDLARGEVLALLGENGAGKSTLVSILFGHYVADEGDIEAFGEPLPPGDPAAALAAGIGMVHQHFTLADNLSVLDNVMLGTEPLWQPFSRRTQARRALVETGARFGLGVEPDALVARLSVGERQRVEILKALVSFGRKQGAKILILDEPTAVLTPQESESLFATLAQLVAEGLSVIFISHKLDEVLRVSDRIAVLRAGRLVATLPAAQADKAMLAELMVGRAVPPAQRRTHAPGAIVCELRCATLLRADAPRPVLDAISLTLRAGEVLAIAGVAGNGQDALADVLCGLHALDGGTLTVNGAALPARPQAWVEAGVARIPEDRHAVGVVGDLPVWENAVLERFATPAFARFGIVRRASAQAHARALIERFDVRGTEGRGVETPTRALSGGNMQKLILGRALMTTPHPPGAAADPPRGSQPTAGGPARVGVGVGQGEGAEGVGGAPALIVANQPTWGLDIGAVAYVHQQLLDACAAGAAVLLISEDLEEIFALADRIAVMHHGQLTLAQPASDWTLAAIGLAMTGGVADTAQVSHAAA